MFMMMVRFDSHRHHAAMSDLAILVLELNGGVMDMKLSEPLLYVAQDGFAGGGRDVGDSDMAGERMHL